MSARFSRNRRNRAVIDRPYRPIFLRLPSYPVSASRTMLDMKPKTNRPRKSRIYRSPLREERAVQTRERILDGLVKVMAKNGIAELSIPLIARQAGVSIPSVYRYFPTKRDLITALDEYAHQRGSFTLDEFGSLETPEDLARIVPMTFKRRE